MRLSIGNICQAYYRGQKERERVGRGDKKNLESCFAVDDRETLKTDERRSSVCKCSILSYNKIIRVIVSIFLLVLIPFFAPPPKAGSGYVDINIVIDTSGSIRNERFDAVLSLVASVVNGLEIGPYKTQVGALRFSTGSQELFRLNTYTDKQDILYQINRIAFFGGRTNISGALQMLVMTVVFTCVGCLAIDSRTNWSRYRSAERPLEL